MTDTYIELLQSSADKTGSLVCMGLDPVEAAIPLHGGTTYQKILFFFNNAFSRIKDTEGAAPSAFKPNQGFYTRLDKPRNKDFSGSLLLAEVMSLLDSYFPDVPVILDAKRGDIDTSSANYAAEIFEGWNADATTVSPYMGSDSVIPFLKYVENGKGVYVLDRTSNKGAAYFQTQTVFFQTGSKPLYELVADTIVDWANEYPGTGAVVGATSPLELDAIVRNHFDGKQIPLLIPGVGKQGGSASEIMDILRNPELNYDLRQVRINSSSGLTHSWKTADQAPSDWDVVIANNVRRLNEEINYTPVA